MAPPTFGKQLLSLIEEKGSNDPEVLRFLNVEKREPFKPQPIFDPNKPVSKKKVKAQNL